jgi:multidrug efflux pump
MTHKSDSEIIKTTHNASRFFVGNRQISWVVLIAAVLWGIYGYLDMPKRKDPDIPVRAAVAICPWPGADAMKVEQLVTREMEDTIAQNSTLHQPAGGNEYGLISTSLPGVSIVHVQLAEDVADTTKAFNDINLRLNALNNSLPAGAGPIQFNSGFGNTAALMLTVASPKEKGVEISLRAKAIRQAIQEARPALSDRSRVTFVVALPMSVDTGDLKEFFRGLSGALDRQNIAKDIHPIQGPGFAGCDVELLTDEKSFFSFVRNFMGEKMGFAGFYVDVWEPVLIRDPAETESKLASVAGDKYSYRQLDDITDLIARALQKIPEVSIVQRYGVLPETIYLEYSQQQLASYGLDPLQIKQALDARNIDLPGGALELGPSEIIVNPSGEFKNINQIGEVMITRSRDGTPVYLRDLFRTARGYQSPPGFLNFYNHRGSSGTWVRNRAITLAVQMHAGQQISRFGSDVDRSLSDLRHLLPDDLILAKTSNQPEQVADNVGLFREALMEAIILVVLVAWIGFWEWRSALLMALSIPLTLAITFGLIDLLGIQLQQVSIATLIVALGLLVDDPVVANDAIKHNLTIGHPPETASWLGPTKLAKAIMFATLTNIVAYLPYLMLTGTSGEFLRSLPIVMACALIASRLVSMTFIPLLGYYLLRTGSGAAASLAERKKKGVIGLYYRVGDYAITHRGRVLLLSLVFIGLGMVFVGKLKTSFFPNDVQHLFYVDVWLPNNATLSSTNEASLQAERIVEEVAAKYGGKRSAHNGEPGGILDSVTTFIGGGGPRFWYTVQPEQRQRNYAQLIVRVNDKNDTSMLVDLIQKSLAEQVPGARMEVRQLQLNAVNYPIEIHMFGGSDISSGQASEGQDISQLRQLADDLKGILRGTPGTTGVRDDWGEDSFVVSLKIDPDRANLSGISNKDVAVSAAAGLSGMPLTTFREGDRQIPVSARLKIDERAELSDLQSLYVYSAGNSLKVPLLEVASPDYQMKTARIVRREHFRTITVSAFPVPGVLVSSILKEAEPKLDMFVKSLPPGYKMVWGGERAKQTKGFRNLAMIMLISVSAIFLALVLQFKSAIKPLLVFAAVPYGIIGALIALKIMGEPFGFMAFLGIASLVGVIVSHVIVLFDFIEDMHEKGEPLKESLLDAGIERLRPVSITVGATMLALIPLAIHGGPLWQPLCYAQIGGLAVATLIELVIVPVFYAIFVLDLKIVTWETSDGRMTRAADGDSHEIIQ